LFGVVAAKDIEQSQDALGVTFHLTDPKHPEQKITVTYEGAVPDTFQPGAEVIVEGSMHQALSIFHARTLMTKCPSKYKKK
jgi:cytochrome c-type biogenesis protein CcmE